MLRVSAIDEFWDKFTRDAFEINAKLTDGKIPGKPLLMNTPKGTEEIANRRPNTFNGIGVNFSNPNGVFDGCQKQELTDTDEEAGCPENTAQKPIKEISKRLPDILREHNLRKKNKQQQQRNQYKKKKHPASRKIKTHINSISPTNTNKK